MAAPNAPAPSAPTAQHHPAATPSQARGHPEIDAARGLRAAYRLVLSWPRAGDAQLTPTAARLQQAGEPAATPPVHPAHRASHAQSQPDRKTNE